MHSARLESRTASQHMPDRRACSLYARRPRESDSCSGDNVYRVAEPNRGPACRRHFRDHPAAKRSGSNSSSCSPLRRLKMAAVLHPCPRQPDSGTGAAGGSRGQVTGEQGHDAGLGILRAALSGLFEASIVETPIDSRVLQLEIILDKIPRDKPLLRLRLCVGPRVEQGVPPELISPDECLHGEGVPRCQDKPRWFDTTSRAEATRDRIVGFGRASVA